MAGLWLRYLTGCEAERLDPGNGGLATVLRIHPGGFGDKDGHGPWLVPKAIDLDLDIEGIGGLDAGAPTYFQDYFPYLLAGPLGEVSGVLSASITYGGVAVPEGWTMLRKLPFGFVNRSAPPWNGIPPFHFCGGSGKPFVLLTYADGSNSHCALASGQDQNGGEMDLRGFVPDNARAVMVRYRVVQGPGQLGSAWAYTPGPYPGPPLPSPSVGETTLRVSSTRGLAWKTSGDARLSVWVKGYHMTEPS